MGLNEYNTKQPTAANPRKITYIHAADQVQAARDSTYEEPDCIRVQTAGAGWHADSHGQLQEQIPQARRKGAKEEG